MIKPTCKSLPLSHANCCSACAPPCPTCHPPPPVRPVPDHPKSCLAACIMLHLLHSCAQHHPTHLPLFPYCPSMPQTRHHCNCLCDTLCCTLLHFCAKRRLAPTIPPPAPHTHSCWSASITGENHWRQSLLGTPTSHTCSAVLSDAGISLSRRYMSMCSGMGTSRAASDFNMVDLPQPLRPNRPYRRP